jgi:hypothetical protein
VSAQRSESDKPIWQRSVVGASETRYEAAMMTKVKNSDSQVEWASSSRRVSLSAAALKKVKGMVERPAAPRAALRQAMHRRPGHV